MKFTDGYWMTRKGVSAFHPAQVHTIETTPEAFIVHASTKLLRQRSDALNATLLTIEFAADRSPRPAPAVVVWLVANHCLHDDL